MKKIFSAQIKKTLFWQAVFLTLSLVLIFFFLKLEYALAFLAGAASYYIPTLFLAFLVVYFIFQKVEHLSPGTIISFFFTGELIKLALSVVLFILMSLWFRLSFKFMVLGFAVSILSFLILLMRCNYRVSTK